MRLRSSPVGLSAALVTAAAAIAIAQPVETGVAERLKATALSGRALEYATDLTRSIGPRVSGTAAYERAAHWAADQFRAAGLTSVGSEPFTIPRGWERSERARARVIAPIDRPIAVESYGWAPSLPDGGIEGDVIADDHRLQSNPERAKGRIVFVARATDRDFDSRMSRAGALAVLFGNDAEADNQIVARVRRFGAVIAALPMAQLSADSADLLKQLLARGPVRVSLDFRNRLSDGPVTLSNVVAEIRGRERPDEFVVVGAHLDSWDFATGAQDNATGVAMVLEAARAIAALGRPPARSIRFALWGAEEQGLLGSAAYVQAHERELDRCVALLNADGGTGRIIGWTTPGREDVMAAVSELSKRLLADLHADQVDRSMEYAYDSDGGPFIRQGIPALDMNVDDVPYEAIHHKATDTIDRVDQHNLAIGAAMTAVTAYAIADAPKRIAPRGPRKKE